MPFYAHTSHHDGLLKLTYKQDGLSIIMIMNKVAYVLTVERKGLYITLTDFLFNCFTKCVKKAFIIIIIIVF